MASAPAMLIDLIMNSPQATALGFALGFILHLLWQKFGNRNDPFGGGSF